MPFCAEVAELVDAADSKSAALKSVWVRFPPPAPNKCILYIYLFISILFHSTITNSINKGFKPIYIYSFLVLVFL